MNSVPEICKKHNHTMYWYGDWYCSECQQEEEWAEQDSIGCACARMNLCLQCNNYQDGDPLYGSCLEYPGMTYRMFGRKRKCKHYIPLKERPWNDGW